MGPVLAALIVVPFGQPSISWFSSIALLAVVILWQIGRWYQPRIVVRDKKVPITRPAGLPSTGRTAVAIGILIMLVFSKYVYLSSLGSYYTFYLMQKFAVTTQNAQLLLFVFLGAVASGVYFGGPLGDRFGRRYVIWFSILGTLPFTLVLPYVGLGWTVALSVVIGFILASAMPAIIVYAQELMPHRFGMISGLFFGFAFGAGGLGAALLGIVADHKGIDFVYQACAFLPAIGLLAVFLPTMSRRGSA
jgi:FSR family fosmidomycin resistance protein-like MFS transporter